MRIKLSNKSIISINKRTMQIFSLLLILLSGSPPWIIWGYISPIYVGIVGLFFFIVLNIGKVKNLFYKGINSYALFSIMLFIFYFIIFQFLCWRDFGFSDIYFVVFLVILNVISDKLKNETLLYFSKIIGVMVAVSFIAWLVHKYFVEIPTLGVFDLTAMKGQTSGSVLMNNHFFFVTYFERTDRFYSVFDEPGVLGTLGALLLYVNKYDLKKWYNFAIFIGGIFTFSLAFYILLICGLIIHFSKNLRKLFLGMIIFVVCFVIVYMILQDNADFQQHILARLDKYDTISELINGRDSEFVQRNFTAMLSNPITALFGYGNDSLIGAGTSISYMRWLLRYGVLGFIIMCFVFISVIRPDNKEKVGFCLLLLLSFLQRPSVFNTAFVLLVVICVPQLDNRSHAYINNENAKPENELITFVTTD